VLLGDQITIAKLLWDETKKQLTKQITEKRIQNKKITEKNMLTVQYKDLSTNLLQERQFVIILHHNTSI